MDEIKSGKEILDEFFENIENLPGVDKTIAEVLKKLYKEEKLTQTNLSNALFRMREVYGNVED